MPHRVLTAAIRRAGRRRGEHLPPAQLALVVEILAAHVRAGRSLRHALADAVADLPEPAATRVAAAAADAALSAPPDEALRALGGGRDVAYLVAAVRLQIRVGGDLALLLDRTAELLHDRAGSAARPRWQRPRRAQPAGSSRRCRPWGSPRSTWPTVPDSICWCGRRSGGWRSAASAGLAAVGHELISRLSEVDP